MSDSVNLPKGNSHDFPTWAAGGTTTLNAKNLSNGSEGEVSVSAGLESEAVKIEAGNTATIKRKWGGAMIKVTNSGITEVEVWTA